MKKILLFPVKMIVGILNFLMGLFIRVESFVGGLVFLFLIICLILALINQMWQQVAIFVGIAGISIIVLLLSAEIKATLETFLEKLS